MMANKKKKRSRNRFMGAKSMSVRVTVMALVYLLERDSCAMYSVKPVLYSGGFELHLSSYKNDMRPKDNGNTA